MSNEEGDIQTEEEVSPNEGNVTDSQEVDETSGDEVTTEEPGNEEEAQQTSTALTTDETIDARFQVTTDDGVDWEQSFTKAHEAYRNLESKLGSRNRPKSLEDYEWDVPEDADVDNEAIERFLTIAHENDMSVDQVKAIRDYMDAETDRFSEMPDTSAEDVIGGLRESWGQDFNTNISAAKQAAQDLKLDINSAEIGNNKPLIELLARIGPSLGEANTVTQRTSASGVMSQEEFDRLTAATKDGKTIADPLHPYWDKDNQKKVEEYYAQKTQQ